MLLYILFFSYIEIICSSKCSFEQVSYGDYISNSSIDYSISKYTVINDNSLEDYDYIVTNIDPLEDYDYIITDVDPLEDYEYIITDVDPLEDYEYIITDINPLEDLD